MEKIDYKDNCYQSDKKVIFVFESFETTLRNEIKQKAKLNANEIRYILIQINEAIKYLDQRDINEILISPDTIAINKHNDFNSINLINLFPYYKIDFSKSKYKSNSYFSPEIPEKFNSNNENYNNNYDKISKSTIRIINNKSFLWSIGVLIYELFFGRCPLERISLEKEINESLKNLNDSENTDLYDLMSNLLINDKDKRITWDNYIHHKFFLSLAPDVVYKILFEKEIKETTENVDLYSKEIYDDNIEVLSRLNFKNLLILNLAHNHIENMEIFNKEVFKNLKVLILEENEIVNVGSKKLLTNFNNLEYLFLCSNLVYNTNSFSDMNYNNLRYLSLLQNNILDISFLSECNLINLNILNLSDNQIYDISCLDKMNFPDLEELYMKKNKIIDISIFQKVHFPKLKKLFLNNNEIREINVFENNIFDNLEVLNLENNSIKNINYLEKVKFKSTLKELYLSNNPIELYDSLNLCYFSSLKISDLSLSNDNLKILSIKLKLYGHNMKNQKNNISILFVPFDLINIKKYNFLNYINSFKILANKDNTIEEITHFFFKYVLEIKNFQNLRHSINFKILSEKKFTDNNEISSNTIISYLDPKNIIKEKININSFFLFNEFNILHEKKNKYNRIPNYINYIDNKYNLKIKCPFIKKDEIFEKGIPQLIDEKELLSSFLNNNYYYDKFPFIYINEQYFEGFLKYLEDNKKYQIYKDILIFKKLIVSSTNKITNSHSNHQKIIAEVIENINYYSFEDVTQIINGIKQTIKGNYIEIINEYIMTIFELLSECLLFIVKEKANYYICPECKSPILFIDNYKEENDKKEIIKLEKDITLNKSIKLCNNIAKCLISSFDSSKYINLKNSYFKEFQNYIPANPPKNPKYINVIYHDENYEEYSSSINEDARSFRRVTNGTFIFSNSFESFETIMLGIKNDKKNKNNENNRFLLITTGSTFLKVYKYLNENNYLNYINNIGIYCWDKSKYEYLMNNPQEYPKLKGIFTDPEEVNFFIEENSSKDNKIFQILKLVSYKDYIHKYYLLHKIIAEYYNNTKQKTYDCAISLLSNFLEKKNNEDFFEGLKTFETNRDYEVITEYTSERIYGKLNNWLLNLQSEAYEKIAYFIGILMYKLNDYGIQQKKMNKNNLILYRGMCISYLDAISYQIYKGKVICFQTFFSTTTNKKTAQEFSLGDNIDEKEKKEKYQFSTMIKINNNYKEDLYPLCFDISGLSEFKEEEEFLYHPYTFFRIKKISIDYKIYQLKLELEAINKKEILEVKINENNIIKYNKKENIIEIKEKKDEDENEDKSDDDEIDEENDNDEENKEIDL